jgi:hypothetical protein
LTGRTSPMPPKARPFCLPRSSDKLNDFRGRFAALPADPGIPDKSNISHFPTTCICRQPADLGRPPHPSNPHITEMARSRGIRKSRMVRTAGAESHALLFGKFHDCTRSRCSRREGDAQLPPMGRIERPKQLRCTRRDGSWSSRSWRQQIADE